MPYEWALVAISGLSVIVLSGVAVAYRFVFADEHDGRALDGREIERLVEVAMVCSPVAEEGYTDVVAASLPRAHADADSMPDAGRHDAVRAK